MAKRSALARAAANFNKRVDRLAKNNPEIREILPEKVKARDLGRTVSTKQERDRLVKELNRFQAPQAEKIVQTAKGFQVTQWELNRIKRANERANQVRQREINMRLREDKNFIYRMDRVDEMRLKPRAIDLDKFANTPHGREAWKMMARAETRIGGGAYLKKKTEDYKKVYLAAIERNLGRQGRQLKALVKALPAEVIYQGQFADPILNIKFISPPIAVDELVKMSEAHWMEYTANMV